MYSCSQVVVCLMQAKILATLLSVVKANVLPVPLWDEAAEPNKYSSNLAFVHGHLVTLLATSFPNMTAPQVRALLVSSDWTEVTSMG